MPDPHPQIYRIAGQNNTALHRSSFKNEQTSHHGIYLISYRPLMLRFNFRLSFFVQVNSIYQLLIYFFTAINSVFTSFTWVTFIYTCPHLASYSKSFRICRPQLFPTCNFHIGCLYIYCYSC